MFCITMGQVPSLSVKECQDDDINVSRLILGKETMTWKPSYTVNDGVNYNHVISVLKKHNKDYEITWSDPNFCENGKRFFKSGIFNGSSLPVSGQGAEWGDHDWPDYTWNTYPSVYEFKRRVPSNSQIQKEMREIREIREIQQIQQEPQRPQQASSIYFQSPNAPSDDFSAIEWKTQEYKAEVTSSGSYLMYEKTGKVEYSDQAGEWKKVKNMAQDKKISKQEYISYRDRLYNRPFNLPIDYDAHNLAKYRVLCSWISRDGLECDRQKIYSYPHFYSLAQFVEYCSKNDIASILSALNTLSCEIQEKRNKHL